MCVRFEARDAPMRFGGIHVRQARINWDIAAHPKDPPDPSLHPDHYFLRCVGLLQPAIDSWDALRDEHFKGPERELDGGFVTEASCMH